MSLTIKAPDATEDLKPRIVVVGVGGAGGNAVNNMIRSNLEGVEFVVANTDAQALAQSQAERKIQLGAELTKGLGAGAKPDIGREAAEESLDDLIEHLSGANMVFITAGMGGGTGTGAGPVIAQAAREIGVLTVGVVTKPFQFEGTHRMRSADQGIEELQQYVDTLIIIPNQNLFRVANEKTTFADAFKMADDVLYSGVRGVTDLMVMPGLINLDFADIRTVMGEMGKAMMGTGEASGEDRATAAAESAISNPLLEDASMRGARGVLINITGGADMTLFEVDEAANRIRQEVDADANIIFGSTFDESLEGVMRVSVVATGIEAEGVAAQPPRIAGLTPLRARHKIAEPAPAATAEPEVLPEVADISTEASDEPADAPSAEIERDLTAAVDDPFQTDIEDAVAKVSEETDESDASPMIDAPVEPRSELFDAPEKAETETNSDIAASSETTHEPVAARKEAPPEPIRPRDAFIPQKPTSVPEESRAPLHKPKDAFREAELMNAGHADAAKTKPSLFSRMTGIGLNPRGSDQPEATAKGKAEPSMAPSSAPATKEPVTEVPKVRPLPSASEPVRSAPAAATAQAAPAEAEADLAPVSKADEEMLEIPAFLRRQAN